MVKETENLERQERAWVDSVLLLAENKKSIRELRYKVVANIKNQFCSVERVIHCMSYVKDLLPWDYNYYLSLRQNPFDLMAQNSFHGILGEVLHFG